jgi:hypothetical protein
VSHPIKCDVCGRCDDEKDVVINKGRRTAWWKWWDYAEYWEAIDVCDYCWNGWKSYMQNRLAAKDISNSEAGEKKESEK